MLNTNHSQRVFVFCWTRKNNSIAGIMETNILIPKIVSIMTAQLTFNLKYTTEDEYTNRWQKEIFSSCHTKQAINKTEISSVSLICIAHFCLKFLVALSRSQKSATRICEAQIRDATMNAPKSKEYILCNHSWA